MPTRSGRTFSPTPPAAQTKGPKPQNGRVTRASTKRKRADSDASLIQLKKLEEARLLKRKRAKKKGKATKVEYHEVIDLTRDEDETEQQPHHHLTAGGAQDQCDAECEAIVKSNNDRREVLKEARQSISAAIPHDTEVQPLWQVDLAGAPPHPSTLIPLIVDESISQDIQDDMPAYVARTERQSNQRQKIAPLPPARVMFTYFEAKRLMYEGGRNSRSQSLPLYTLSTGEYMPFPVTNSYHLGAIGRYVPTRAHKASSGSVVDPAAYVFDWGVHCGSSIQDVSRTYIASLLSSPNLNKLLDKEPGLFEALKTRAPNDPRLASPRAPQNVLTLPVRALSQAPSQAPKGPAQASPPRHRYQSSVSKRDQRAVADVPDCGRNSVGSQMQTFEQGRYIFTFGPFRGKAITEATMPYLRSLERNSQLLSAQPALSRAFTRHFPHGIFRYEVDNYRIDDGPFELRRLSEVPNSYIYDLQQDSNKVGESVVLQHALKQRNRELGWNNSVLDASIRRYHQERRQYNSNSEFTRT